MNLRTILIAISLFSICKAAVDSPLPGFPTATSGHEFEQQAEAFVRKRSSSGEPSSRRTLEMLKDDRRDWEPVLGKLIREPSEYSNNALGAFGYSHWRGTAKDPLIVEAAGVWFDREVRNALERYDKYSNQGKLEEWNIAGSFHHVISSTLEGGDPAYLTRVLAYLNSPAEEKIGMIERGAPSHVARALRSYGNATHIDGARKLVSRLRDLGKDEISDDIERSIARIEKDTARKALETGDRISSDSYHPTKADPPKQSGEKERKAPWIIGGLATALLMTAGFFFLKRAKSQ